MKLHLVEIPRLIIQRRASAILGLTIIVMLWTCVMIIYGSDVQQDYREVERRNQNYAMLFEENVLRSIGEIDKALLYLRRTVEAAEDTDYQTIVSTTDVLSEIIVQMAIIDSKGIARGSNARPAPTQLIDISDREHFKVHVNSNQDNLFISKPLVGRASKKWSVQFTRRFSNKDGSFAGVVVASMNPEHFTSFYDKIDLGAATTVAMIGSDGVVRSSGGGEVARLSLGQDISGSKLFSHILNGSDRVFRDPEAVNDDALIVTPRKVRGYPLWVTVSTLETDIYKSSWAALKQNTVIVAFLTCLILIALEQILRAEAKAAQKAQHLQLTLEHIGQGIMLVTKDRQIPIINPRCAELLLLPERMIAEPPRLDELAEYETKNGHVPVWKGDISPSANSKGIQSPPVPSVTDFTRPDGTCIEVRTTTLPDGAFVQTFTDITTRRKAEAYISQLASQDPLTNLLNRRVFRAKLQEVNETSKDGQFAVMFMDMDRFKVVNDTIGHRVGDRLLIEVAHRLESVLPKSNVLARLGGDEFAVLLPAISSRAQVAQIAQQIIDAMTPPFKIDHHVITATISIGVALGPDDGKTEDDLLMAADLALYAVKVASRGTYRFFEQRMNEDVNDRREIEVDLREALEHKGLELHYQPIIDLQHNTISGFEALARWHHATKGMIPPAKFISVAEDCGLIIPLGNWVLLEACRTAAQWPDNLKISVNVSAIQLTSAELPATVRHVLAATGLHAERLVLECTETIFIDDNERTLATLHKLKEIGVQIALDDFGTGYSSLSYLRRFPFDTVKIDRSFISDLGGSTGSDVIVQAVIQIADALNMRTVAEGIESDEQLQLLRILGCKDVQGYRLGKPVQREKAAAMIEGWSAREMFAA